MLVRRQWSCLGWAPAAAELVGGALSLCKHFQAPEGPRSELLRSSASVVCPSSGAPSYHLCPWKGAEPKGRQRPQDSPSPKGEGELRRHRLPCRRDDLPALLFAAWGLKIKALAAGAPCVGKSKVTSIDMQHLTREQAQRLAASRPDSSVLAWSGDGERREDALSAETLAEVIEALKAAVVREVAARPGLNELMLRWQLSRQPVPTERIAKPGALPEGYTWGTFAQQYPTFWGKLTSASTARMDVIMIHTMLDARRRFEAGELASEEEVNEAIYSDLIALNMRKESGGRGVRRSGSSAGSGSGSGSGSVADERLLLQRGKLRREVLHRMYAGVMVPAEELERRGVAFKASMSVLHDICKEDEARKERSKSRRKEKPPGLTAQDVMFGRMLLQIRVALAKRFGGLPEALDPKGVSYMPTYVRSAQVDLRWTGQEVALPAELSA
jgi:hypothetical protein